MAIIPEQLPARIKSYLNSYNTALRNVQLSDRYRIPDNKQSEMAKIVADIFLKNFEVKDLPEQITSKVGLKKNLSFLLSADIVDQHLVAFPNYLGELEGLRNQWRQWGRQLGAKIPSNAITGKTARQILNVGKPRATDLTASKRIQPINLSVQNSSSKKFEKKAKKAASNLKSLDSSPLKITSKPNSNKPKKASIQHSASNKQIATSNLGRTQFIERIKSFDINNLRPEGQSGAQRLQQVGSRLTDVLSKNPQDKSDVANAFKQSKLFGLYQEQGQDSARNNMPLDQVIYARYQAGKPYLLKEEFQAVANIVKSIQ